MELTQKQRNVLEFITTTVREIGGPPTRREISQHFKWRSDNAAQEALLVLERKGAIKLVPGRARGITVITAGTPNTCPHCGGTL